MAHFPRQTRHRVRRLVIWAAVLILPLIFASASFAESGNHNRDRPAGGPIASAK